MLAQIRKELSTLKKAHRAVPRPTPGRRALRWSRPGPGVRCTCSARPAARGGGARRRPPPAASSIYTNR
eukprot:5751327-Prymnesium_polylepis.2